MTMTRLFFKSAVLVCLAMCLMSVAATAQTPTLILPGKWNVEQYRENSDYLQVVIDMRSVNSKIRVRGIQGTATLYARNNRFLKMARISIPPGELVSGKTYVHYVRCGVSPVFKVYGISASARVAVYPMGTDPSPATGVQSEVKVYPTVPLVFDRNLKLPRATASNFRLLSPRPPRKSSRRAG